MKKDFLLIATAATMLTACVNLDTLNETDNQANGAISFESYTSLQTKAENSSAAYSWYFYNHQTSFKVWGYKNTSSTLVFNADVVTVGETTAAADGVAGGVYTYTYSPLRFWDKSATTYEFYAAAPQDGGWTFVSVESDANDQIDQQNECYFTTSSTLTGTNISNSSSYAYVNSFKDANGDVDKLIAAPKSVSSAQFKQTVQFDFIHILSRLNVTVKADADLQPANNHNFQKIVLTSLSVKNLNTTGDFNESTTANTLATGSNARWSNQGTPYTTGTGYTALANTEVTTTAKYILQSLVIPQDVAFQSIALDGAQHASTAAVNYTDYLEYNAAKGAELANQEAFNALPDEQKIKTPAGTAVAAASETSAPYLVLTYTIQQTRDNEGNAIAQANLKTPESFTVYYNLANAFGFNSGNLSFNEGWQNTLNITIKPATIVFSADVAAWSTAFERGVVID